MTGRRNPYTDLFLSVLALTAVILMWSAGTQTTVSLGPVLPVVGVFALAYSRIRHVRRF